MAPRVFFKFPNPNPSIRRELVDLLYTSFPQVLAINVTATSGAIVLAMISGDTCYGLIASLILITATARFLSLGLYRSRSENLSDEDVLRWERIYGLGSSAFGIALGLLSFRALQLGDAPGAWLAFGLSMSFCVGMVSRAAVRPWIVLTTSAFLLAPTIIAGFLRPEAAYRLGAGMLLLFWVTLREASRHLSTAFIERLEAKHALACQASHDFLTGLPNRAAFLSALQAATGDLAIVAIDLDGFKPVNDHHGHRAGDDLLRQVAERLSKCVGADGIAARFGGDEFMLLKSVEPGQAGHDSAFLLAQEAVAALSTPFLLTDVPVRIGASAGILVTERVLPAPEDSAIQLLEQVDRALYAAKRAGGGRWEWSNEPSSLDRQAG